MEIETTLKTMVSNAITSDEEAAYYLAIVRDDPTKAQEVLREVKKLESRAIIPPDELIRQVDALENVQAVVKWLEDMSVAMNQLDEEDQELVMAHVNARIRKVTHVDE